MLPVLYLFQDMEYSNDRHYPAYFIAHGEFRGYKFWIKNLNGRHPTAYIRVPITHKCANKPTLELDELVRVHGGITYSEATLSGVPADFKHWFIGWDYGHFNDFSGYYLDGRTDASLLGNKKWRTIEIVSDCVDACIAIADIGGGDEV